MVDRTAKFFGKADGRDKFCKMIQYAARFSMHVTQSNQDVSGRCKNLFGRIISCHERLKKTFSIIQRN